MNESSAPIEALLEEPEERLLIIAIPESKARVLLSALQDAARGELMLGNGTGVAVVREFRQTAARALCG